VAGPGGITVGRRLRRWDGRRIGDHYHVWGSSRKEGGLYRAETRDGLHYENLRPLASDIAPEHLEFLGDLEGVAREEAALLAALPADGEAVVPVDEPLLAPYRRGDLRTTTFGEPAGDVRCLTWDPDVGGTRAVLCWSGLRLDRLALGGFGFHRRRPALGAQCPGDRGIELFHRAQAEADRVTRLDVRAVPVGAVAHRRDRRLGGADQLGDLSVGQLGMILGQPGDRVRLVLALGDRRVARPAMPRELLRCAIVPTGTARTSSRATRSASASAPSKNWTRR
jgi:hypothetical protein